LERKNASTAIPEDVPTWKDYLACDDINLSSYNLDEILHSIDKTNVKKKQAVDKLNKMLHDKCNDVEE
jgi:hypothetical protein